MTEHEVTTDGLVFAHVNKGGDYGPELKEVAREVVAKLLGTETEACAPVMLLGKVQSGKTRAFVGAIACAFDSGFDVAVILTKGTVVLSTQTVKRLGKDFASAVAAEAVHVHDVMQLPAKFTGWAAKQCLVLVVKKQTDNLDRLKTALLGDAHHLRGKRVLFIDDEADWASVGFRKLKGQLDLATIASMIDKLRKDLAAVGPAPAFLQVTATPYSLYLQPETLHIKGQVLRPTRPVATVLVPVHSRYIGGDFFFDEAHPLAPVGSRCHSNIDNLQELGALKSKDGRRVTQENVLKSKAVEALRRAIVTFIAAGSLRRWQEGKHGGPPKRFAFIVHTETGKAAHSWQEALVGWIVDALRESKNAQRWIELLDLAFADLSRSMDLRATLPDWGGVSFVEGLPMPSTTEWREACRELLDALDTQIVNSEQAVLSMLDDDGQLRLTNPLNIFVGGQILDRGITIANLIGFYYGRNPAKFQQDTVLQHARLFGARPVDDLLVTRFYTTARIHAVLCRINEIDAALREAFETNGHTGGVVFIQRDMKAGIVPCSPSKIAASNTATLRPHRRRLPFGFQTRTPKADTMKFIKKLDAGIVAATSVPIEKIGEGEKIAPILVSVETAVQWLKWIEETLEFGDDAEFDWDALRASVEYLVRQKENPHVEKLWLIVRTDRDMPRYREDAGRWRFSDSPDTSQREGKIARELSIGHTPTLMMLRQNGHKDPQGWNDCPFWWPVLMAPKEMKPVVFAQDFNEEPDAGESD